jgi:hypothetical protein
VYMGDCSDLVCAAESVYTNCGSLGGRTVSWEALEGVEYYLFVYSPYAPGSFELRIEDFEPATNSQCTNAEGPLIPANQTIVASTLNSISDGISGCVSGFNNSAGLWYSVLGKEGLTYHVDTCSEETNFDTEISIYRGSCENELECVGGNDYACGGSGSAVQWKTEEGVAYYIKVNGFYGPVGEFGMTLSSSATPKNDDCLGSIVLTVSDDEFIVVSTAGSTKDDIPICSQSSFDAPGTWYQMEGKGKVVSLSTCSSLTKASTAISVFSGSCQDLSCVSEAVVDYACQDSAASSTVFLAEEGITYYILLQSPDGIGGDVELTITEVEGVENDFCQRPSIVAIDGGEVAVTTEGATGGSPSNECYFDPSIPDVWYLFDGSGDVLQATACSSEFSYFSMAVVQGNCTDTNCLASVYPETETCATVQFRSVVGETYRIIFQASPDSGSGKFSLSVNTSSVQGPENDLCSNAELIDPSRNTTIVGSIADAIPDFFEDTCSGQFTSSRDLWYQVVGNGAGILASSCGQETDFDTQLSVYSSTTGSCSNLECVVTNDDACGLASQVWWLSEQDSVYFIRVHGYGGSFGNFSLNVREQVDQFTGGERY